MKFIRAKFKNFRLLRDVEFDFSTDEAKNLTVVRAANETGKTTAKTALIWVLYGSDSLPKQGKGYPLHPADISKKNSEKVEIYVELDYCVEEVSSIKGKSLVRTKKYRIRRSCVETVTEEGYTRSVDHVVLHELTPQGSQKVLQSDIKYRVEQALPSSLKDVFFTDGDAALAFIAADSSTSERRRRVRSAVESLLGLNDLEALIKRTTDIRRDIQSNMDTTDYSQVVVQLQDIKQFNIDEKEEQEEKLIEVKGQLKDVEARIYSVEAEIERVLKLGDKRKLADEISVLKRNISNQEGIVDVSLKGLRKLLRDRDLAYALVKNRVLSGISLLDKMRDEKKLPQLSIPVVSQLLDAAECFCGSSLQGSEGEQRIANIKKVIEDSEASDKLVTLATELYFGAKTLGSGSPWLSKYEELSSSYFNSATVLERMKKDLEKKENEVAEIKDDELELLRGRASGLKKSRDELYSEKLQCEVRIKDAIEKIADSSRKLEVAERKLDKDDSVVKKYNLASKVVNIFSGVLESLRDKELKKVSSEMNRIFLEMVGADSENSENSIIKSAALTEDFDIQVLGPNGHKLDPDQDLNGASRRAITLSFILALTKVSRVEAPNIIDTPLGMMAGYVKRSVLLRTIEESAQPILFLTHSEIQDVEDILDKYAGVVFTLTNPGHYPVQLVNKPNVTDARVMRCECDHRVYCKVCERRVHEIEVEDVI